MAPAIKEQAGLLLATACLFAAMTEQKIKTDRQQALEECAPADGARHVGSWMTVHHRNLRHEDTMPVSSFRPLALFCTQGSSVVCPAGPLGSLFTVDYRLCVRKYE